MKKLLIAILSIFLFTLTGCNISTKSSVNPTTTLSFRTTTINTTTITRSISSTSKTEKMVKLPDLTGMNREEISITLDSLGISHIFGFDQSKYYGNSGYNKFVSYNNLNIGDEIKQSKKIRVITSPLELPNIDQTALKFERDATGKSFINDSYGYVTWAGGYNDGDTAYFIDSVTKERFRVRFLAIDAPEVDHGDGGGDPWGDAASSYLRNLLQKAKSIILESDDDNSTAHDIYGRYLAFVWIDGILFNYGMVCEAYSNYTGTSKGKYKDYFLEAESLTSVTGRRFYGERDPNFHYS